MRLYTRDSRRRVIPVRFHLLDVVVGGVVAVGRRDGVDGLRWPAELSPGTSCHGPVNDASDEVSSWIVVDVVVKHLGSEWRSAPEVGTRTLAQGY